jgi:acetyl-CoA synthetase
MLKHGNTYKEVYDSFQWKVPAFINIGVDICDKWAHQHSRLALIHEDEEGNVAKYTFCDLKNLSNKFANALKFLNIKREDRVGILLPQCPETAISHIAVYKIGAIAVPLFTLFGTDALEYRLTNCKAKAIITDGANLDKILEIVDRLPHLKTIVVTNGRREDGIVDFWELIEKASDKFSPVQTRADDPALIIYTSGTTGPPKGALHAHRVVLGHLPGVEFPHNFFPVKGDLFWTPADWAWIGGLIDVLFPSLYHGIPVVAHRAKKFDPEEAFHIIAKHGIRNAFIPPTALRFMMQVKNPRSRYDFSMRSIGSGGETLGGELLEWGQENMGVDINEFYGQTEVNLVIANCAEIMTTKPGSMGKTVPGHTVEVVEADGSIALTGTIGEVAIKYPDPVMFLEYWRNPEATKEKFVKNWCRTGDLARKDESGYFWFVGRKDDIITSAGYRIGPSEIEDCLMQHPAVGMVAVVGSPDEVRTEIVKAFIVLKPGLSPDQNLFEDIKNLVKSKVAAHEYPREIEFVKELPMTTTGKIKRRELKQLEIKRKDEK